MPDDIKLQTHRLRQLLEQLMRTQAAFDSSSEDYATLQSGIDQATTRYNDLREQLSLSPLRSEERVNPFLNPNP